MTERPDDTAADPAHDALPDSWRDRALGRPASRRGALLALGGAGLGFVAAACAPKLSGNDAASSTSTTSTPTTGMAAGSAGTSGDTSCEVIPEETAGPYPGDGSNGANVLDQDGVVRSDIRSSFGSSTTTATGVPLRIDLTIQDSAAGCAAIEGAAVYVWHCDIDGGYSMYSEGVTNENYLRGVQATDADGMVSFTSIFPAAYSGRWPHIHFEVYADIDDATGGGDPIATSQLALPQEVCGTVYATSGYATSVRNLARTSLTSDNVFSDDGAAHQLATMSGDVDDGYVATLTVPI